MKKARKILSAMFVLFTIISSVGASDISYTPFAFDTYVGQMEILVNIPSYTSSIYGYTVDAWSCPIRINYQINYNLNTGKITSVSPLGSEINGTAFSPTEQARISSLNYENPQMRITDNGYSITCDYTASATLIYTETPGFPYAQETIVRSISGSNTIYPGHN